MPRPENAIVMTEDRTALRSETLEVSDYGSPPPGERARERPLEGERAKGPAEVPARGPAQEPGPDLAQNSAQDQADSTGKGPPDNPGESERKKRRPLIIAIACVIAVLLVAGGAY